MNSHEKAEALTQILPCEKYFGTIHLTITVIPSNKALYRRKEVQNEKMTLGDLFYTVFDDNPIVSYIHSVKGIFSSDMTYIVFTNQVVQYFNDNLGDINGLCSTLYQEIAKEIFEEKEGIFFCTDLPDSTNSINKYEGIF